MSDILERLRLLPISPRRGMAMETRQICREAICEIELLRERERARDTVPTPMHELEKMPRGMPMPKIAAPKLSPRARLYASGNRRPSSFDP